MENSEGRILLKVSEVARRTGLARVTIYKRIAAGKFPRQVYPAPRAPRWYSDEIQAWIDGLADERDVPAAA